MTPIALTIAGSDSSGGAGIQADLKTFAALGVYGASVVTALTAQNTRGVAAVHDVPADFVARQIDAVFADLDVRTVKIGMLSQAATVDAVAEALDRHAAQNVVVDPVMVATSGGRLIADGAVEHLRTRLMPRARLVTPNLPEAAALLGASAARDENEMAAQARALLQFGAHAVLIKGGHGNTSESVDLLADADGVTRFAARRIVTQNTHGTGCTLSSAVAAGFAKGLDLKVAVQQAKDYVTDAIAGADTLDVGHGHGPLNHFVRQWSSS